MKRRLVSWLQPVAGILVAVHLSLLAEATPADQAATKSADSPATPIVKSDAPTPGPGAPYRQLAPWVMQTVDPMRSLGETVSHHDVVEVLAADPKLSWAKDVSFRHDVWTLDFKFKPVRLIWVDVPHAGGHMEQKMIWYIVYSVTNTGKVFHPVQDVKPEYATGDGKQFYEVKSVDRPVRFFPEFVLDTFQRKADGNVSNKLYPDRVIPVAMAAIRAREDANREFLTTVEMCREIEVGKTLWGIATWEDIDLATFKFSVVVSGLTNAYHWRDRPGVYKSGEPILTGREFTSRVLKLNFWRPADKFHPDETEIHYGLPDGVDYEWVYR